MNKINPSNELIVRTISDNNSIDQFVITPEFNGDIAYQFEVYDSQHNEEAIISISLEDAKAIYNYLKKDMEILTK